MFQWNAGGPKNGTSDTRVSEWQRWDCPPQCPVFAALRQEKSHTQNATHLICHCAMAPVSGETGTFAFSALQCSKKLINVQLQTDGRSPSKVTQSSSIDAILKFTCDYSRIDLHRFKVTDNVTAAVKARDCLSANFTQLAFTRKKYVKHFNNLPSMN